jgi:hypothetical protein
VTYEDGRKGKISATLEMRDAAVQTFDAEDGSRMNDMSTGETSLPMVAQIGGVVIDAKTSRCVSAV